jgi:hypothetical protein
MSTSFQCLFRKPLHTRVPIGPPRILLRSIYPSLQFPSSSPTVAASSCKDSFLSEVIRIPVSARMSVSSDFWAGREPRSSSGLKLPVSFRRASTATVSPSAGSLQDGQQRRPIFGTIEPARKSSFVGLPLRLIRSRTKTMDNVREVNGASSQSATSTCFVVSADSISGVKT